MPINSAAEICEEILSSKKYATLHKPMILRVCEQEYKKYSNTKERIKGTKNTLHAMYGAYLFNESYKKANKLLDVAISDKKCLINTEHQNYPANELEKILRLHASTKERLPNLKEFYQFIFDNTGPAESILDIGCGFNPFTLPFFPKMPSKYHALDIDTRIADLNNRYFAAINLPELSGCADIAVSTPDISADVVFLFKLLPLIDRQIKGRSANLLKELKAKFFVVTYPTKTLTGKEKGMQSFYAAAFKDVLGGNFTVAASKEIGTELVYIVVNMI